MNSTLLVSETDGASGLVDLGNKENSAVRTYGFVNPMTFSSVDSSVIFD